MIRKIKHPKGRGERLAVKAKKAKIHSNASPVYKLLAEHSSAYATHSVAKEREEHVPSDPEPAELHP